MAFTSQDGYNGCLTVTDDKNDCMDLITAASAPPQSNPLFLSTASFTRKKSVQKNNERPRLNASDVAHWTSRNSKVMLSSLLSGTLWENDSAVVVDYPSSFTVDEKFELLRFAFPDIDGCIVEDVLVAKNYELADAAQVLSSFTAETGRLLSEYDIVEKPHQSQWTSATSSMEWVVVHDEWEVIDEEGTKVPTYCEVLAAPHVGHWKQRTPPFTPPSQAAQHKVPSGRTDSDVIDEAAATDEMSVDDYSEIKHFGQRRLSHMKKEKGTRTKK